MKRNLPALHTRCARWLVPVLLVATSLHANQLPDGFVNTVLPQNAVLQGTVIQLNGWAADPDYEPETPLSKISVYVDSGSGEVFKGNASHELSPFLPAHFGNDPDYGHGNWSFALNTASLGAGTHTLVVRAFDKHQPSVSVVLGMNGGASNQFAIALDPEPVPSTTFSPSNGPYYLNSTLTINSVATDANGNLTTHRVDVGRPNSSGGLDYNSGGVYNPSGNFFGAPSNGSSSSRTLPITLDREGTWEIRTTASDVVNPTVAGDYVVENFHLITVTDPAPTVDTILSPSSGPAYLGTVLTLTSTTTDLGGNLEQHRIDIGRPDGSGGTEYNALDGFLNGSDFFDYSPDPYGETKTRLVTLDRPGTWYFRTTATDEPSPGSADFAVDDWETIEVVTPPNIKPEGFLEPLPSGGFNAHDDLHISGWAADPDAGSAYPTPGTVSPVKSIVIFAQQNDVNVPGFAPISVDLTESYEFPGLVGVKGPAYAQAGWSATIPGGTLPAGTVDLVVVVEGWRHGENSPGFPSGIDDQQTLAVTGVNGSDPTPAVLPILRDDAEVVITSRVFEPQSPPTQVVVQAKRTILVSDDVLIKNDADVVMEAGHWILVGPDFQAERGSRLRLAIDPTLDDTGQGDPDPGTDPDDGSDDSGLNPGPTDDTDGDGVYDVTELLLGLDPEDPSDVNVHYYNYDRIDQLKEGPGGEYIKDEAGNILEIRP